MFEQLKHSLPFRLNNCWLAPIPGDEIINSIRRGQLFEFPEMQFVKSFLCPGQTFWDIGANFGLYTLLATKRVGSKGSVLAVEPDPRNVLHLRINILLNFQWRVKIFAVALGEHEAEVDFCSCSQGAYSSLKVAEVPGTIKKIRVRQTTLDTIATERHWPYVDFLKMDVEGAELFVLRGGAKFFSNGPRPILMCEFSDRRSVAFGYQARQIYDWLATRRYQWFCLTRESRLVAQPPKDVYDYDNLVAVPEEKIELIQPFIGDT